MNDHFLKLLTEEMPSFSSSKGPALDKIKKEAEDLDEVTSLDPVIPGEWVPFTKPTNMDF